MTSPAPVSLCMIVKNESGQLESCLRSIRPYVSEIVVVDTGSSDSTPEIARKHSDRFEVFTECNDPEGRIASFSMARQRSFDLAGCPWVMWVDGDDEVHGAERIPDLVRKFDEVRGDGPAMAMFPYEYSHDRHGNVTCLHYRERLVTPKDKFRWKGPVHEVLNPECGGINMFRTDDVRIIHRRRQSGKPVEPNRNLRILKAYYDKVGESDVRQLYYLGLEYANSGDLGNSIKFHRRYVELSGWDDEKCLACLEIAKHYQTLGDYENAIQWALRASTVREGWGEPYLSLAKSYYYMAQRGGPDERRNWERCVHFARTGIEMPPTNTILFVNPMERSYEIHKFLNLALNKIGDVQGALESASSAMKVVPDDSDLKLNKDLYEEFLAKKRIREDVALLRSIGKASDEAVMIVNETIEGRFKIKSQPGAAPSQDPPAAPDPVHPAPVQAPPDDLSDDASLSMIRALWKQLLIHDEVLGARSLLRSAPWRVRDHPEVLEMSSLTDKMLVHADDLAAYDRHYLQYGRSCSVSEAIPLPNPVLNEYGQWPRYDFALRILDELSGGRHESLAVLDVGCYDGWLTNRIGQLGYRAYGVDSSPVAVDLANRKAAEFGTGARHAAATVGRDRLPDDFPKQFDAVLLFELYEHVPDTVVLFKDVMSMIRPGGTLLLSTPRGSWLQGRQEPFHEKWDQPSIREHIRAPILPDVRRDLEAAGFRFVSGSDSLGTWNSSVPGQASLLVRAERPPDGQDRIPASGVVRAPPAGGPLDIILYVGPGPEPWSPRTVREGGIGGSETAAMEMAVRLVRLGHRVRLFGDCEHFEGIYDGVQYLHHSRYKNLSCDVLITSRRPQAADPEHGVRRRATLCWVHDVNLGAALTHSRSLRIDRFLCLSRWHRDFFLGCYDFVHPSQVVVTRNGVDLSRFSDPVPRNPRRAVYSSSPDRGLEVAVRCWPRVRERVPDAELHVFYGFLNWEATARSNGDRGQLDLIEVLKRLLDEGRQHGVHFHGRVDQRTLAREFLQSGVWAYPTWFSETSCQLAGTLVSTRDGMKPIEDVRIGDMVLTHAGRFRRVTELIRKPYSGTLYSVKRKKDFRPVCLTAEHPLFVHRDGAFLWLTPREIEPKADFLFTPRMQFGTRESVLLSDYVDMPIKDGKICRRHGHPVYKDADNEVRLTPEVMFILGLFAADGHAGWNDRRNAPGAITFALHKDQKASLADRVQSFFNGKVRQTSENGIVVTAYNSPWASFLRKAIGVGRDKRIPSFVWECPEHLQQSFLDGMFAGDGSTSMTPRGNGKVTKPFKFYTSVSPSLAYGFAQLLSNLGFHPGITYSSDRGAYTLNWSDRRVGWHREVPGGFVTEVESVLAEHYDGIVYNFEVEEDRSYVTDRTAVHNCITAMEAQAAGLRIVSSPIAALTETVGPRGSLIPGDWLSAQYQDQWVEAVANAMLKPGDEDRTSTQAHARENFCMDKLAADWSDMLHRTIEEVERDVVPQYKAVAR